MVTPGGSGTGDGPQETPAVAVVETKIVGGYNPPIEKLRGRENYSDWAFAMKMILIQQGLWGAIEPETGEVVTADMKRRALSTICLGVEKHNYSHVKTAKDALTAWTALKRAFEDSGLTRKIGLLRQLTSVMLSDCDSVETYVDKLISTAQLLLNAGFEVGDEWLAALLLKGLPDSYEPMIMGLEASGAQITTDLVKSKILQDVKKESTSNALYSQNSKPKKRNFHKKGDKKQQFNKPNFCSECGQPDHGPEDCPEIQSSSGSECDEPRHGIAFLATTSKVGRGCLQISHGAKRLKCWKCHNFGHVCRECPLKFKKKKGSIVHGNGIALSVVCKAEHPDSQAWYFDSGATSHMTRHRGCFGQTFKQNGDNNAIVTAAGQHLNVVGKGDVKIVNRANEEDCVSAKKVKFVPGLNTNILPVSRIVKKGHKVVFHKQGCRVVSAEGEILATGSLANGLFKLNQRLISGKKFQSGGEEISCRTN